MPLSSDPEVHRRLSTALTEVAAAEDALDAVLQELRTRVRAEKVTITPAVEEAFARLRRARAALEELRALVEPG